MTGETGVASAAMLAERRNSEPCAEDRNCGQAPHSHILRPFLFPGRIPFDGYYPQKGADCAPAHFPAPVPVRLHNQARLHDQVLLRDRIGGEVLQAIPVTASHRAASLDKKRRFSGRGRLLLMFFAGLLILLLLLRMLESASRAARPARERGSRVGAVVEDGRWG